MNASITKRVAVGAYLLFGVNFATERDYLWDHRMFNLGNREARLDKLLGQWARAFLYRVVAWPVCLGDQYVHGAPLHGMFDYRCMLGRARVPINSFISRDDGDE